MNVKIHPSKLTGSVKAPSSKSMAHRLLIAASLGEFSSIVHMDSFSQDIFATKDALRKFGALIDAMPNGFLVSSIDRKYLPDHPITIDCNESGSTLRFMIPLAAAFGVTATFIGAGRLAERPVGGIINALSHGHGVRFSSDRLPLTVSGKLQPGSYEIDGSMSSQFITGMLFALSVVGNSTLKVLGDRVSVGYIEMTKQVLNNCKSGLQIKDNMFLFGRPRLFDVPDEVVCEGDCSQAAFFAVAGAIGGDVEILGIDPTTKQGDFAIFDVLKKFGATVEFVGEKIIVKASSLHASEVSVKNIPDLAPIIAVLAAYSNGVTTIKDVARLRIKESDRLMAIEEMLGAFGIKTEEADDVLKIYGGSPKGGNVDGKNDHRIVMAAAVCGAFAKGETVISSAEAINKSYPKFFDDFLALGGKYDRL